MSRKLYKIEADGHYTYTKYVWANNETEATEAITEPDLCARCSGYGFHGEFELYNNEPNILSVEEVVPNEEQKEGDWDY